MNKQQATDKLIEKGYEPGEDFNPDEHHMKLTKKAKEWPQKPYDGQEVSSEKVEAKDVQEGFDEHKHLDEIYENMSELIKHYAKTSQVSKKEIVSHLKRRLQFKMEELA